MWVIDRILKRIWPFIDLTAWILAIVCLVPLFFIDPVMVKTIIQWSAPFLAFVGVVIIISRLSFPTVDLSDWVELARSGNVAAGLVVLSIAWFMSVTILALVLWAKT